MQEIRCTRTKLENGLPYLEMENGLPSVGFPDADTESLGSDMTLDERDRDPNDEISVSSPTATREEPPVNFGLVICN